MTYFLSIQVGDVRTLSPRKTQRGQVWIERSIEMESRMAHPCHGAVNKPSAMNTKPSADVHRRIPERNFRQVHLFTQKIVNTHVETKNVQTQICSIVFITSCSAQNRPVTPITDKKQCIRGHRHCRVALVHVRLSVLTHAVTYNLQTTSACMHTCMYACPACHH